MDTPPPLARTTVEPGYVRERRGSVTPSRRTDDARARVGRWARTLPAHVPALLPALGVFLLGSPFVAAGWYLASRIAYVGYLSAALLRTSRSAAPADPAAQEAAWLRFRRRVSWVMDNDAAAFVALTLVTRGLPPVDAPTWLTLAGGALLGFVGLGVKAWATASLRPGAYYWRNFFLPAERAHVSLAGPYRWLSDPMYSVGYAPLYGLALFVRSGPGLVAAAVAQATMLLWVARVERRVFDAP